VKSKIVTRKFIPLFALVAVVAAFPLAASAQSDAIPAWIKNTAGWWADDQISETEFVNSMEYLIGSGIIQISSQQNVDVTELTIGFIPIEKADELTPKAESLEKFLEQKIPDVDFKIVVPNNYEFFKLAFFRFVPERSAPDRFALDRLAPSRSAPTKFAPNKSLSDKSALVKSA